MVSNYDTICRELRDKFVAHKGKKELTVYGSGNLMSANYPQLIKDMIVQISKNIKDETVSSWVIPNFSTSTENDKIVGSLVLMSAMKQFFGYKFVLECGLPEVTLLGTVEDWLNIKMRAKRLLEFDTTSGYMVKWHVLLDPILQNFVDSANGKPDLEWWNTIVNHLGGGSGPSYLSGWVTVFSVFNNEGNWIGSQKTITNDWRKSLNDTVSPYPIIDSNDIACSEVTVNVTVDDNGKEYKTMFTAGIGGYVIDGATGLMPVSTWSLVTT